MREEDFFFSIDLSDRLALVNGYPIISEKSIAPARSKTICFVQSKKKQKKPQKNRVAREGWERQRAREWKEMGERCEEGR